MGYFSVLSRGSVADRILPKNNYFDPDDSMYVWRGDAKRVPRVLEIIANRHVGQNPPLPFVFRAFFPAFAFDALELQDGWAFASKGDGYIALTAARGLRWMTRGENAYRELRSFGQRNVWLCRLGRRELGRDGFLILSRRVGDDDWILVAGNCASAVLTGTFHFLRLLQTRQDVRAIDVSSGPRIRRRILARWDNLDGSIERGYAGRSLSAARSNALGRVAASLRCGRGLCRRDAKSGAVRGTRSILWATRTSDSGWNGNRRTPGGGARLASTTLAQGGQVIGDQWESEKREFKDARTGRTIQQLTATGNNVHLYFTENSFDANKNEIIFRSDRASGQDRAPHEDPFYNLFRLNLDTGEIVQLTDERRQTAGDDTGSIHSVTKTPDGRIIVYRTGNQIKKLDGETGETSIVYEETGSYTLGSPSIAPHRRYIAFARNENVRVADGPNYTGFKDRYYLIKDGRITLASLDGSGWFDVFKDTHQVGHFQFCPVDGTLGSYCHEGPWNLVTQRMWLLDFVSREARPCFRQREMDSVGHEFWTRDGYLFFDNRGPGHDGTITSDRTQAVARDVPVNHNAMIPFVGLADRRGEVVKRTEMPFYCNHYHANPDNTVLVGDDVDELVLIDISGQKAKLEVLCRHRTSWHTQAAHCHPTWSWDGEQILYASDDGGRVNLYLVKP